MSDLIERLEEATQWDDSPSSLIHEAIARIADLERQLAEARKALEPFAKIKPSTACAEDGSEAEPYRVFLAARDDFDFTGADLAAARRALEGGE